ncbi:hypothetical protein MNBD_GAMMA21-1967 [hydrothermal vent metagenome]|uniref:Uncharacterized protein n=1 Tax=hydrothermal vent metagenome TaxID=652676 RepID=A0A3B1B853_9ZZZZ
MNASRTITHGGESYVIRFYRQGQQHEEGLPGILEEPVSGQLWSFKNLQELNQILEKIEQLREEALQV